MCLHLVLPFNSVLPYAVTSTLWILLYCLQASNFRAARFRSLENGAVAATQPPLVN